MCFVAKTHIISRLLNARWLNFVVICCGFVCFFFVILPELSFLLGFVASF